MKTTIAGLALALVSLTSSATATIVRRQQGKLPVVTTEGNAFWANGERFYIRGIAYQPGGAADAQDPLLKMDDLRRDVKRFKELDINTIRVYTVDNSKNHDEAMALLDENGIYVSLDTNTPDHSLNRRDITSLHASYNDVYLQSIFATVDAFAGYNNLLLFFSANEVINARNNTNAAPYIKAVTRDLRNYVRAQAPRPIPVGYSSADVAENIESQALYFACGDDESARSDFFAFNDYSWCDPSSFQQSGWDVKVKTYANYSLPLFLSEFGCIKGTRMWDEVASLYSRNMTGTYSGGIAYEYSVEPNGYGIVHIENGQLEPNPDYSRLVRAFNTAPNPPGDGGARRNTTVPECPPATDEWLVSTTLLPAMPENARKYITDGAGPGKGLAGNSQWAGTPSKTSPDLSDGVVQDSSSNSSSTQAGQPGSGTKSSASAVSSSPASLLLSSLLASLLVLLLSQ